MHISVVYGRVTLLSVNNQSKVNDGIKQLAQPASADLLQQNHFTLLIVCQMLSAVIYDYFANVLFEEEKIFNRDTPLPCIFTMYIREVLSFTVKTMLQQH